MKKHTSNNKIKKTSVATEKQKGESNGKQKTPVELYENAQEHQQQNQQQLQQ